MFIEITSKSRFKLVTRTVTFKQLSILNPVVLYNQFRFDNRFILTDEALEIVNSIKDKVRIDILAIDSRRKEIIERNKNIGIYVSSSDMNSNNYNNRWAREFICGHNLTGI